MQKVFRLIISLFLLSSIYNSDAQNLGKDLTFLFKTERTPGGVVVSWVDTTNTGVSIFRKLLNEQEWNKLATITKENSFNDTEVIEGYCYEYKVEADYSSITSFPFNLAYGYGVLDLRTDPSFTRKPILVLVENHLSKALNVELEILKKDLTLDGYDPFFSSISKDAEVTEVKDIIKNHYNFQGITYLYLIGHIPVPYSGFQSPDGHSDHLGAWPADGFYADINDNLWTENPFFAYTNDRDNRNTNTIDDGKYDQNVFPSDLEIVVSRIDFSNLPSFMDGELELTRKYLKSASDRKHGLLQDNGQALIQDSLRLEGDGFSNNIYRNFDPIVGRKNLKEGDFLDDLSTDTYLATFAASYANDTDALSIASTQDIASQPTNALLTMLMGSYFGDWDTKDNFLRANLASGNTLNVIWTGRPNYFFHHLATNKTIGECFRLSCNNGLGSVSTYEPKGSFNNSTSMSLHGDPTVRLSYKNALSSLSATEIDSTVLLTWSYNTSVNTVKGVVISKYDSSAAKYRTIATLVDGETSFYDFTSRKGTQSYIVNTFFIDDNFESDFLNYSLGTQVTIDVQLEMPKQVYPSILFLTASTVFDKLAQLEVNITAEDTGKYILHLERKLDNGEWIEIASEQFYKTKTTETDFQEFFFDTLQHNLLTSYRAKSTYNDSIIYSNDTSLIIMVEETNSRTTVYPNPCYDGKLYINGDSIKKSDITILNDMGASQFVNYNEQLNELNLVGYRKGLYLVMIKNKTFKIHFAF